MDVPRKTKSRDFPGGAPSNTGKAGWIPGWGTKTPHDTGQLSPCIAPTESTHK